MKLQKITATMLAAAVAVCVLVSPAAGLEAKADNWGNTRTYVNNQVKDIPRVSIQTPQDTVRLYAGLSWRALEDDIGVRLNVTESGRGPAAKKAFNDLAASLGATEVKTLDMDLEAYINSGWTGDIPETNARIRVCITLPEGSDPAKDYAVLSIKADGVLEVLGDLDAEPATVTVDSDYFDTFMIVSAPAGTFNAYRVAAPNVLDTVERPVYVKKIGSTIPTEAKYAHGVYSLGVLTDAASVKAAAGGQNVSLELTKNDPGAAARKALNDAIRQTSAYKEKDIPFCELQMKNGKGERINSTNGKLRITMTVPFGYPAYADYALAVLNMDGSVTIMPDIDSNDSTITVDTDQFRTCVFLWGRKGAFEAYR